jgi:ferredoxin
LARLILDIHRAVRPSLAIMDGIVAMEGEGPSAGQPRNLGVLMASSDLVALDTLACQLIGLPNRLVPLLDEARNQGLGATSMEDMEIVGEDWRQLQVADFKKVSTLTDLQRIVPLPRGLLNWIRNQWTAKPRIDPTICAQCGICENGCPVNPAAIQPGLLPAPPVNDETCIHCYCCHEFCPHHAIQLRHSWLARSFNFDGIAQKVGKMINQIRQRPKPM